MNIENCFVTVCIGKFPKCARITKAETIGNTEKYLIKANKNQF